MNSYRLLGLPCLCFVAACGGASIPGSSLDDGGPDDGGLPEASADDAGPQDAEVDSGLAPGECALGAREECTTYEGFVGERRCTFGARSHVWSTCRRATCTGIELPCTTGADAAPGVALCVGGVSASACGAIGCAPGTSQDYGNCQSVCDLAGGGVWSWQDSGCYVPDPSTPLVLSFDRARVEFTQAPGAFVLARDVSVETRWVSARTPWLAVDLDGDGRIEDGSELFGSMTRLPDGRRAPNGFVALAALDDDHDGLITRADAAFDRLLVWSDDDQDRQSTPGELRSAADVGLVAIHLDYASSARCTDGDCEVERARFEYMDDSGRTLEGDVIDVHLKTR